MPKPKRVRKPTRTGPLVISVGNKAPEKNRDGYVTKPVYNADTQVTSFYEVRDDIVKDVEAKGIKVVDEDGHRKSDLDLTMELNYGSGYGKADSAGKLVIVQENQEDITKRFGEEGYKLMASHLTTMSTSGQYYDYGDSVTVNNAFSKIFNAASVEDTTSALDAYYEAVGKANQNAYTAVCTEHPDAVPVELLEMVDPELAEQCTYTDSNEDSELAYWGLTPESFTKDAVIGTFTQDEDVIKHLSEAFGDTTIDWSQMSSTQILSVWAYLDSAVTTNTIDVPDTPESIFAKKTAAENDPTNLMIQNGEDIFGGIKDQVYQAYDEYASQIPEVYYPQEVKDDLEDYELRGISWDDLTEEQRYRYAKKIIENYETQTDALTQMGQEYADTNGYNVTDESAIQIEQTIFYLKEKGEERLKELGTTSKVTKKFGVCSVWHKYPVEVTYDETTGFIDEEFPIYINSGGGSFKDGQDWTTYDLNNDISYLMYQKSTGQTLDAEKLLLLEKAGFSDIAELIESKEEGCFYLLTDGAADMVRDDWYQVAGKEKLLDEYKAYMYEPDFEEYSEKGAALENDTEGWGLELFGWTPFQEIRNKVKFGRENYNEFAIESINGGSSPRLAWMKYNFMTDDEVDIYNYLLAKDMENGTSNADTYLNDINSILNERQMGRFIESTAEFAEESPVVASALTLMASPFTGAGYLYAAGTSVFGGEVDPNHPAFSLSRMNDTIRETVSSNMSDTAGFFYNTGMSIGDFLIATGISGGSQGAVLALMGTGTASNATLDAFDRGATQGQALTYGFFVGAAEVVFEKFSLGNFFKIAKGAGGQTAKQLVKNIFSQAGIEASEETATAIADTIIDATVMQDKSTYNLAVQAYMAQDMTREEAEKQASMDVFYDVLMQTLGGLLSGGVIGSGVSAFSSISSQVDIAARESQINNAVAQGDILVNSSLPQNSGILATEMDAAGMESLLSRIDTNAAASSAIQSLVSDTVSGLQNLSAEAKTAINYDGIFDAYLQFGQTRNQGHAANVLNTALGNINSALQGDISTSVARELNTQQRAIRNGLRGVAKTQSNTVQAVANNTIDALIDLPKEALADADYNTLMKAYRAFEANPSEANAAKVVETGKQALGNMDVAQLAAAGVLTEEQASMLDGLKGEIENIDSGEGVGDNGIGNDALTLSTRFLNKMDPLWENAGKIKPIEGYQDIVCHGDTISLVYRDANGNETNVSAMEFAQILKDSPVYEGRPIRLIACEAGADGSVVAQTVADQLGVEIMAPTHTVFVLPNGEMFVGPSILERTGTWKIFRPKKNK